MNENIAIVEVVETLAELELVIERGLKAYVEVGNALRKIQQSKKQLYREAGYSTFEDYCEGRWDLSVRSAEQRIKAAEVFENTNLSSQTPPSFTQARELATLTPQQQREVAQEYDFSQTTVAQVKEIVVAKKAGLNPALMSSESEEWYTPPQIVIKVLEVLGRIDLDPCSSPQKGIPAAHHFTKEDDGLAQLWTGKIYMNPPYGRVIDPWIEKLVRHYNAGDVEEAIALVPARVETAWFNRFNNCVWAVPHGRLKFIGTSDDGAPFPSALVYLGTNPDKFNEVMSQFGNVWIPYGGKQ